MKKLKVINRVPDEDPVEEPKPTPEPGTIKP